MNRIWLCIYSGPNKPYISSHVTHIKPQYVYVIVFSSSIPPFCLHQHVSVDVLSAHMTFGAVWQDW